MPHLFGADARAARSSQVAPFDTPRRGVGALRAVGLRRASKGARMVAPDVNGYVTREVLAPCRW